MLEVEVTFFPVVGMMAHCGNYKYSKETIDPALILSAYLLLFVWPCSLTHLFMLRSVCQWELAWALRAPGQEPVLEVRCPVHLCPPSPPSPPVRTCSGWCSQPSSPPRHLDTVDPLEPPPWPSQCHWLTHTTCQAPVILDSPLQVQILLAQHQAPSANPEPAAAVHETSLWVKMEMLVC